jgi:hypothetical protein
MRVLGVLELVTLMGMGIIGVGSGMGMEIRYIYSRREAGLKVQMVLTVTTSWNLRGYRSVGRVVYRDLEMVYFCDSSFPRVADLHGVCRPHFGN